MRIAKNTFFIMAGIGKLTAVAGQSGDEHLQTPPIPTQDQQLHCTISTVIQADLLSKFAQKFFSPESLGACLCALVRSVSRPWPEYY
jgi:hypothetical protein